MQNSPFYPEVRYGDRILFAPDPNTPEPQWRLGEVVCPKVDSCDLIVYGERGSEQRRDCLYIDDPQCQTTRLWAQPRRGVFKLAPVTKEFREMRDELSELRALIARLQTTVEETLAFSASSPPFPCGIPNDPAEPRRPRGRPRKQSTE